MYENLSETIDSEGNKAQVIKIENNLTNLIKMLENNPTNKRKKINMRNNMLVIVERNLYFNQINQQRKGLKILTPNQMLSRLPISSAQFKVGNNSEKLKNKIRQILYSSYRSEKLTKQIYKTLIDII